MATRRDVTSSRKAPDGGIRKLCGSWGEVTKRVAWQQIDGGTFDYYSGNARVRVVPAAVTDGFYLTTATNSSEANNLDRLPDC
jgi:hypothetical protein